MSTMAQLVKQLQANEEELNAVNKWAENLYRAQQAIREGALQLSEAQVQGLNLACTYKRLKKCKARLLKQHEGIKAEITSVAAALEDLQLQAAAFNANAASRPKIYIASSAEAVATDRKTHSRHTKGMGLDDGAEDVLESAACTSICSEELERHMKRHMLGDAPHHRGPSADVLQQGLQQQQQQQQGRQGPPAPSAAERGPCISEGGVSWCLRGGKEHEEGRGPGAAKPGQRGSLRNTLSTTRSQQLLKEGSKRPQQQQPLEQPVTPGSPASPKAWAGSQDLSGYSVLNGEYGSVVEGGIEPGSPNPSNPHLQPPVQVLLNADLDLDWQQQQQLLSQALWLSSRACNPFAPASAAHGSTPSKPPHHHQQQLQQQQQGSKGSQQASGIEGLGGEGALSKSSKGVHGPEREARRAGAAAQEGRPASSSRSRSYRAAAAAAELVQDGRKGGAAAAMLRLEPSAQFSVDPPSLEDWEGGAGARHVPERPPSSACHSRGNGSERVHGIPATPGAPPSPAAAASAASHPPFLTPDTLPYVPAQHPLTPSASVAAAPAPTPMTLKRRVPPSPPSHAAAAHGPSPPPAPTAAAVPQAAGTPARSHHTTATEPQHAHAAAAPPPQPTPPPVISPRGSPVGWGMWGQHSGTPTQAVWGLTGTPLHVHTAAQHGTPALGARRQGKGARTHGAAAMQSSVAAHDAGVAHSAPAAGAEGQKSGPASGTLEQSRQAFNHGVTHAPRTHTPPGTAPPSTHARASAAPAAAPVRAHAGPASAPGATGRSPAIASPPPSLHPLVLAQAFARVSEPSLSPAAMLPLPPAAPVLASGADPEAEDGSSRLHARKGSRHTRGAQEQEHKQRVDKAQQQQQQQQQTVQKACDAAPEQAQPPGGVDGQVVRSGSTSPCAPSSMTTLRTLTTSSPATTAAPLPRGNDAPGTLEPPVSPRSERAALEAELFWLRRQVKQLAEALQQEQRKRREERRRSSKHKARLLESLVQAVDELEAMDTRLSTKAGTPCAGGGVDGMSALSDAP